MNMAEEVQTGPAALPHTALVVVDLMNPCDFARGDSLFRRALPAAHATAMLRTRAHRAGIPVVYANDVFDSKTTGLCDLITHLRGRGRRARTLVEALSVDPEQEHFVAKPMYSGFFRTGLETLLRRMRIEHLILTGVAADICVLATAFDAYMRGFELSVPCDCIASESAEAELWALRHMARVLGADVRPSDGLPLPHARLVE
jgi:nicotinamidase-related amidase